MKTLCCGICGTDLHAAKHTAQFADRSRRSGGRLSMDPTRDVVFGHEFCCEIVERGPGTDGRLKPGTLVCSMPMTIATTRRCRASAIPSDVAGGFAQYMPLAERLLLEGAERAARRARRHSTEPIAVGWHAVQNARLTAEDVPLVVGCGPVGLAVIAGLAIRNVPSDHCRRTFRRRGAALALRMGADVVVDPGKTSPYPKTGRKQRHRPTMTAAAMRSCSAPGRSNVRR